MHYLTLSYTHKNTALPLREKIAFAEREELLSFYRRLLAFDEINEAVILSTCNRVEIITSAKRVDGVAERIVALLCEKSGLDAKTLRETGALYIDADAVHHHFCMLSSLDSIVIGETQITGQVKDAFALSYEQGFCGQKIARIMHNGFRCAAAVRNETAISKNPISIASVAVAKAKELYGGNLGGYTGVVVGAGEMGSLVAKHLAGAGANVVLVNRDLEKARLLAESIDSVTVTLEPFSQLPEIVNHYRLLFSATGAEGAVIGRDIVKQTGFERHWFDIAVPRDIEPIDDPTIHLYAVDDLRSIMDENIRKREAEVQKAYAIAGRFTEEFFRWLQTLSVGPMIKEIRDRAKEVSEKELSRALRKGYIPAEYEEQVRKILHQAFNGFLHHPTQKLKKIAEEPQADTVVQAIQLFFGLNASQRKALDTYKCDFQIQRDLTQTKE